MSAPEAAPGLPRTTPAGQQQELEPESLEQQLKGNEACGAEGFVMNRLFEEGGVEEDPVHRLTTFTVKSTDSNLQAVFGQKIPVQYRAYELDIMNVEWPMYKETYRSESCAGCAKAESEYHAGSKSAGRKGCSSCGYVSYSSLCNLYNKICNTFHVQRSKRKHGFGDCWYCRTMRAALIKCRWLGV